MKTVVIVDYGAGNLDSVARAVQQCGSHPVVSGDPRDLGSAERIILPGVGSFPEGMQKLRERGLADALTQEVVANKIPFLGICLGMQFLAEAGEEVTRTSGLGWIEGEVTRFIPDEPSTRVPHVGWNEVVPAMPCELFNGIPSSSNFYFVHSYHMGCRDHANVLAQTPYCGGFVSAVRQDHIFGVQFHPEKSQRLGLKLISNFLSFLPC